MGDRFSTDPILRRRVAESSPGELMASAFFWRAQPGVVVTLALSFLILIRLAPYSFDLGSSWGFLLTLIICGIGLYGIGTSLKAIARVQVETVIIDEIEARARDYLNAIKASQMNMVDLDQLEEDMLPRNQSQPPLSMIRLFQHVCNEAKNFRLDSSINLIQPYREEALDDIFRLQSLQKIALWGGILGTFIGLLGAIGVANFKDIDSNQQFILILQEMFKNLFSAFRASLGGLEVAMVLGILLLVLRKKHEAYFLKMEQTVDTIISLTQNAFNKSDVSKAFAMTRNAMAHLSDRVDNQTKELSSIFGSVQQRIDSQTTQIDLGLDKLAEAGARFDEFLKQINQAQEEFINHTRDVYQDISMKTISGTLDQSISRAGDRISDSIYPSMIGVTTRLAEFNDLIGFLKTALQNQSQEVSGALKLFSNGLRDLTGEVATLGKNVDRLTRIQNQRRRNFWDILFGRKPY